MYERSSFSTFFPGFSSYESCFWCLALFFFPLSVFWGMRIYSRKESLSRALLQVSCVFRRSDTYLLLLGELGVFASQVAEQCRGCLESWWVQTACIKTLSSLFSQFMFFLRLFSGSGLGNFTSCYVLSAMSLEDIQSLFYFISLSLHSIAERACMKLQGSYTQTWIFQAVWTQQASMFSPVEWGQQSWLLPKSPGE